MSFSVASAPTFSQLTPARPTVGQAARATWFTVMWQGLFMFKLRDGVANEKEKKFMVLGDWQNYCPGIN